MGLFRRSRVNIPVVRLSGAIGMGSALRPGLSLATVELPLARAFAMKAPCVALIINSPGGSPAQSSLIAGRIEALSKEKDRPVIAFVEDVAASGGYWLATAADEIIADATSIVGSIGVISASFGFVDLLDKVGVERRVYTAGESKSVLDPFQPEKARDIEILKAVQGDIHDAFIGQVKGRRGDKLADNAEIFSGRFWSGTAALPLGLIDGLGNARAVLRERYGEKVRLRVMPAARPSLLRRRLGLQAEDLFGAARTDALFARYGL
ncbi:MAG: S49 family peptidase [Pseudomonadota bacterium]